MIGTTDEADRSRVKRISMANLRGDLVGGLVSATIAVPLAMGYGMFAFVSLGAGYVVDGVRAGLYTAVIVGAVSVLLAAKSTSVFAPRVTTTFFLGALLYGVMQAHPELLASDRVPLSLAIVFSVIVLGGACQALFGLIKLGTLIKFAPHPVMAGFQNAAAALLFLVQLESVCGFDEHIAFTELPNHLAGVRPLSVLIAAVTCVTMWNARKFTRTIPPVLVGIATGTILYYACVGVGLGRLLGPIIMVQSKGTIGTTTLPYLDALLRSGNLIQFLPTILGGALALAIISSIDALLCAKLVAPPGGIRIDGDRLLVRLGIANLAAGGFGGITGGFNIGASITNRALGARSSLAVLFHCTAILAVSALLLPWLAYMPRTALSGVIMVIAIQHVDGWSVTTVRQFVTGTLRFRRYAAIDLLVMLLVAILSITINIVVAVFIGVMLAIVVFLARMRRSIVRRTYRCDKVHSRTSRTSSERDILERYGNHIMVAELQGALFFGSAETLANEMTAAPQRDTTIFILDLRRTTEIDSTGAQALRELDRDLGLQQKRMLIVVAGHSELAARLDDFGVIDPRAKDHVFPDVDRAIEHAEDALLLAHGGPQTPFEEISLNEIGILAGMDAEELASFRKFLKRATYATGEVVFRQGERGTELLMITQGTASAYLDHSHARTIRLATFSAGTIFGELAILDDGLRSASVLAEEPLVCYALGTAEFTALETDAPSIAIKLLRALGRELSGRIRSANRTILELEA
jgi:sulfate permease, SulP family